jgi:hypothetical protein
MLYRDRHLRRQAFMRFQGATLTEPYVSLSVHTALAIYIAGTLPMSQ